MSLSRLSLTCLNSVISFELLPSLHENEFWIQKHSTKFSPVISEVSVVGYI